jgi:hypothetical protein
MNEQVDLNDDSEYYEHHQELPTLTGNPQIDNAVLWEAERDSVLKLLMERLTGKKRSYDNEEKKWKIITFNADPLAPVKVAKLIVDFIGSLMHKGTVLTITSDHQVQQMVISSARVREEFLDEMQLNFNITNAKRGLLSEIIENNLIFLYNSSLYGFSLKMIKSQISLTESRTIRPPEQRDKQESFWSRAHEKADSITRRNK